MEGDVFANFNMAPQSKYGAISGAIWRILDPSAYGFGNARVSLCRGGPNSRYEGCCTREGCNEYHATFASRIYTEDWEQAISDSMIVTIA